MSLLLLDLDEDFKDLTKSIKLTQTGLSSLKTSFTGVEKGLKSVSNNTAEATKNISKLASAGKLLGGLVFSIAGVIEVAGKLDAALKISGAIYSGWKEFQGVTKALNFSEAITGSDELRQNLTQLEQTSNTVIDGMRQGFSVLFDNNTFNQFASRSISAYAQVEQAAYRLGTITVSGNERSIDSIDKNIASMRKLQAATNDTKGSVEILNAQYDIASAGFTSDKDNVNVGKAAIGLSEAGFGELAGSTNAVVRALRALGDGSDSAQKRAAQLFETTKVGLLTLDQLTPEVGGLAVQSKQLGLDFSEMLGAISGLTTQGISSAEAGTRINSLLSDIAAGSAEANQYLAQFRDEAGKPIQINATVLKNKGLAGVIKDLQAATGGRTENIQKIFGNQMSVEAVQLFSSLGTKSLEEYSKRIQDASESKLESEASGKTETVSGAFEQAKVKSQKGVEAFGQGNAASVIDAVAGSNEVLNSFSVAGAKAVGEFTGNLQKVQTIFSSIGGTIISVFSIAAPVVMFGVIMKMAGKLINRFKEMKKEGETPWETIKRAGLEFIEKVEQRFYVMVARMREGIDSVKQRFDEGVAEAQEPKEKTKNTIQEINGEIGKQTGQDLDRDTKPGKTPEADVDLSQFLSRQKPNPEAAPTKTNTSFLDGLKKSFADGKENISNSIKDMGTKFKTAGKDVGGFFKNQGSIIKNQGAKGFLSQSISNPMSNVKIPGGGAIGKIGDLAGKAAPALGKMAMGLARTSVLAVGAMVAFQAAAGWMETMGNILDKSTNPQINAVGKSIEGLGDNILKLSPKLSQLSKEFQGLKDPMKESGNFIVDSINGITSNWSTSMNFISGGGVRYAQTLEAISEAQAELNSLTDNFNKNPIQGSLTLDGAKAEKKLQTGQLLTGDDEAALRKEVEERKKIFDTEVELARQQLESAKKNGSKDDISEATSNLAAKESTAGAKKREQDVILDKKLGQNALNRFNSIDTTIPLSLAIPKQNETAIKTQLGDLGAEAKKVFGGKLINPKQFYDLMPQIENSLGAIETQVELDPESASKLLGELKNTIEAAGGDFGKILAAEPKLRAKYSQLMQAATNAGISQIKTIENTQTAGMKALQSSGFASTGGVSARINKSIQESIDKQIKLLETELNDAGTSQARKIELSSQIAEANAQKLSSALEGVTNQVNEEFSSKEKLVSFSNNLSNSFSTLANTALVANSAVGKYLNLVSAQIKAGSGEIKVGADKKIAEITGKLDVLERTAGGTGAEAEQAAKELPGARELAQKEIDSIKINAVLAEVAQSLELADAKIKDEFSTRNRMVEMSEGVSSSFSSLAGTASSLFQNSNVGAAIGTLAAEISAGSNKAKLAYDEQNRMLEERNKALKEAVVKAKAAGADQATIDKLQKAADKDTGMMASEKAYLKQKFVIDSVNEKMSVMAARVNEANQAMQKQAQNAKDSIDLDQRRVSTQAETNKSNTDLTNSMLGAFGKNNPFTEMLQQRNNVKQAEYDAQAQKAGNVNEAKKEMIDLSLEKAMLDLEQQSYENSLTQTQLLSDLITVTQGGEAQFTNTEDVQSRLNSLPDILAKGKDMASQRSGLIDQKMAFVQNDLTARNLNVDKEMFSKQINTLTSGGLNPANADLLGKAMDGGKKALAQSPSKDIKVGSLKDGKFSSQVGEIKATGAKAGAEINKDTAKLAQQVADAKQKEEKGKNGGNVHAPVSIVINVTGGKADKFRETPQSGLKQYVGQQIQSAMSQLGKKVARGTRTK